MTRWNGGCREAEHHLPNFVLPLLFGIAGCLVFGFAAEYQYHWSVLLVGFFLIIFSFLTILVTSSVFIIESYPQWAGWVFSAKHNVESGQ